MKFLVVFCCLLLVTSGQCFLCYIHNDEVEFTESSKFYGFCDEDQYCAKVVKKNGETIRGCASRVTSLPGRHLIPGCHETHKIFQSQVEIMCFCDSPLCNAGHRQLAGLPVASLALVLALL